MTERKLVFTKKDARVIGADRLKPASKWLEIDIPETDFTLDVPSQGLKTWKIQVVSCFFETEQALFDILLNNQDFELTVDDSEMLIHPVGVTVNETRHSVEVWEKIKKIDVAFKSGSTSKPKLAIITKINFTTQSAEELQELLAPGERKVKITTQPFKLPTSEGEMTVKEIIFRDTNNENKEKLDYLFKCNNQSLVVKLTNARIGNSLGSFDARERNVSIQNSDKTTNTIIVDLNSQSPWGFKPEQFTILKDKFQDSNLDDLLEKALTGSEEDKVTAIKEVGKTLGEISAKNQTNIKIIKTQLATSPEKLREAIEGEIENQLSSNNLTKKDLSSETKKLYEELKNVGIKEPTKIQELENKISQEVGEKGAAKKLIELQDQLSEVLKNKFEEEKTTELKTQLVKLLNNSYIEQKKGEVKQLLTKLERYLEKQKVNSSNRLPWHIIIPSLLIIFLIVMILVITLITWVDNSKKKKKDQ